MFNFMTRDLITYDRYVEIKTIFERIERGELPESANTQEMYNDFDKYNYEVIEKPFIQRVQYATENLTPMQKGRLQKLLQKLYRDTDGSVMTLEKLIENRKPAYKTASTGNNWNRRYYNSLTGDAQEAYEKRVDAEVCYTIWNEQERGLDVPKTVYDALILPTKQS